MFTQEGLMVFGHVFFSLATKLVLLFMGITFLVGIIQEYVNHQKLRSFLTRGKGPTGNILGAIFGSLTPFCTCSTIPIMLGLLEAGVPFGITMSFFWASPLLNPIIISLLFVLFGWKLTFLYAAIIFPVAVMFGILLEKFGFEKHIKSVAVIGTDCAAIEEISSASWLQKTMPRVNRAAGSAVTLFRRVFPYLLVGTAIGAFIHGFIPEELVATVAGPERTFAIPIASVIGIPMYIRGATILPIGSVLADHGMNVGAVMALVISGAGASLPELTMLSSIFERKLLVTYVLSILFIAIISGYAFSALSSFGL